MKRIKNIIAILTLGLLVMVSCHDLEDLNVNPNGVDPGSVDPNLLLPTVITDLSKNMVSLGFGNIAGVMQHTQKDGWSSGHNNYDWDNNSDSWKGYYDILRTNKAMYERAVESDFEFHQGAALVLRAYTFGIITDLWGDAPYTAALKANLGEEFIKPIFDDQATIYNGILADLEMANEVLSKEAYVGVDSKQDVLYAGDASKWRKFANSLALRYYMRLSAKDPSLAQAGINKITSNPSKYPLVLSASDDANVAYAGATPSDSWPTNTVFDEDPSGAYMRIKMCNTLVVELQQLSDPRLGVWANKITTPLLLDSNASPGTDEIVDGKRRISQDVVDDYFNSWNASLNYDEEYVGIPPGFSGAPSYNLNPDLAQGVFNPHVSQLNDIYKETSGELLLARLISAAEVHFILAEAASMGWGSGTAEMHYREGVKQSFNAWGVEDDYENYIAGAPMNGLEDIIKQKWIASWSAATEAWFDYRRTGLPALMAGEAAKRQALPLRFYYNFDDEISINTENSDAAILKLEPTEFKGSDISNNSAWSKMWLLQGTNKPY